MVGAALSDIHLGSTRFAKMDGGRNAHSIAVEAAWFAAIDAIIASGDVQLCTIAGDVFEHHRVGVHALMAYRDGVRRLRDAQIYVVVIAGNHDVGRSADSLTPLVLSNDYEGVYVVTEPTVLRIDDTCLGSWTRHRPPSGLVLSVAAFPFVTLADPKVYRLAPDPSADVNILVAHCEVTGDDGLLPKFYGDQAAFDVKAVAEQFDVLALGDYHSFTRLHPTGLAFYSGSLERTSTNMWAETAPKGWVWYDTATKEMELREVKGRVVVSEVYDCQSYDERDLELTDGRLSDVTNLNNLLWANVEDATDVGWDDLILRLVVEHFPRAEKEQIDWALVRQLKERCAHFQLDIRFADEGQQQIGDRREGSKSLAEAAREFFREDEGVVRDLAFGYMEVVR